MVRESVSSRRANSRATASSANESPATPSVSGPGVHLQDPYAEIIIRRDMETWTALARPEYFAQRRADFAGCTPWFRGLQTGFWSTNTGDPRNGRDANGNEMKYCTGLYIAGCPPVGRYVDSEVIITSINGAENTDKHIADRCREMNNNVHFRVPVGVAVSKDATKPDNDNITTFPCAIPEGIDCVALGWFLPTNMWPKPGQNTKGETKTVWMIRLEKVDLSQKSWWSNRAHASLPFPRLEERDYVTKAVREACRACGHHAVRLFQPHFVCLNVHCPEWFRVHGEHVEVEPNNIVYNDDFLSERYDRFDEALAPRPLEEYFPNLYPTLDQFIAKNYPDAHGTQSSVTVQNLAERNEALLNGISCPQCGLANSRIRYEGWHCRNTDCRDADGNANPFFFYAPPPAVTPQFLEDERQQQTVKTTKADNPLDTLLGYRGTVDMVSHQAHELDFGNGCRVTVFRPKPHSLATDTADELFRLVQGAAASGALGLARRSVSANGGMALTNHFVENYGERYHLPFALSDIPLAQAPTVVRDALTTANWYMWEYFDQPGEEWKDFNEVYVAAYLSRKMGMSFHDDGEKNLGPVIGTWTLGGRATFKLCIKPQFDYGRPKKGSAWMKPQDGQVDPVPTGCTEESFRRDLKSQFERGEITSAEWTAQLQSHMDAHMSGRKKTYGKRVLVSFTVQHGDLVIMWGPNTQRYMEHAVDCKSPMRFAVTLRRVTQDMGTAEQWERLDKRLESDRAFTPVAEGRKREAGEDEGEEDGEEEEEEKPAAAKKSRAKKARAKK